MNDDHHGSTMSARSVTPQDEISPPCDEDQHHRNQEQESIHGDPKDICRENGNSAVKAESDNNDSNNDADTNGENENVNDPEPDWETIARTEPAKTDVPLFLSARDRRFAGEARFGEALDMANTNLKMCCDDLLNIAADVINDRQERLYALETQIKHDFVENEDSRANMSKKLAEFAAQAQKQFEELMNRLANASGDGLGNSNADGSAGTY